MARIVAIANQKGGVGKTTTAVNLAASLAIAERRTLLVDADPQGNATSGIGIAKEAVGLSLYDVLMDRLDPAEVTIRHSALPHLDIVPATQDLVGAELELVDQPHRETALRDALASLHDRYDYILVDCPPSLGLLTLNVLTAAQGVIIPIQCEYYALEGISQLLNTVRLVQQNFNPALAIDGVLLTMFDSRLNLCRQVAEDAKEYFGQQMFRTAVPRNVRLAEAPSFGKPILLYDVQSVGAKSYLAVAQELLRRTSGEAGRDTPAADARETAVEEPSDMVPAATLNGAGDQAVAQLEDASAPRHADVTASATTDETRGATEPDDSADASVRGDSSEARSAGDSSEAPNARDSNEAPNARDSSEAPNARDSNEALNARDSNEAPNAGDSHAASDAGDCDEAQDGDDAPEARDAADPDAAPGMLEANDDLQDVDRIRVAPDPDEARDIGDSDRVREIVDAAEARAAADPDDDTPRGRSGDDETVSEVAR